MVTGVAIRSQSLQYRTEFVKHLFERLPVPRDEHSITFPDFQCVLGSPVELDTCFC